MWKPDKNLFLGLWNLIITADADTCKTSGANDQSDGRSLCSRLRCEGSDRYTLFEEFCKSGLCRLGLTSPHEIDLFGIWKGVHSFTVSCCLIYQFSSVFILVLSFLSVQHIMFHFFKNENLNIIVEFSFFYLLLELLHRILK